MMIVRKLRLISVTDVRRELWKEVFTLIFSLFLVVSFAGLAVYFYFSEPILYENVLTGPKLIALCCLFVTFFGTALFMFEFLCTRARLINLFDGALPVREPNSLVKESEDLKSGLTLQQAWNVEFDETSQLDRSWIRIYPSSVGELLTTLDTWNLCVVNIFLGSFGHKLIFISSVRTDAAELRMALPKPSDGMHELYRLVAIAPGGTISSLGDDSRESILDEINPDHGADLFWAAILISCVLLLTARPYFALVTLGPIIPFVLRFYFRESLLSLLRRKLISQ